MSRTSAQRPRRPAARGEHFDPHVPGIQYGALDDLVGYAIRRAQILIYEDFLSALAPWDITPQRYSALTLIAANASLKLTDLARILGIARSGAVQLVNQLQDLGYVERQEAERDRRAYALAMTPDGRAALAAITAAVQDHDARISAKLGAADRRKLIALLGKLG
ncbi:MarR family winged helix-turn-helix transcriptional regulator [Achromobacter arsenitoxydans]|uniref:MarR family transcriptional regulator n=1 Tax=Achromobacter arsenitoxydans SY8 TaxID=477184 RepID=H0F536_9BURK|nr:MarR family winged helix-turn-helix transcriptional regulator [Achromobacter arsenitoxydans]EHK66615.1 MarR family transcriptional regulator [Achromobacter arsenitoxydans SY8]